jgi:hypothetical protein
VVRLAVAGLRHIVADIQQRNAPATITCQAMKLHALDLD